jgi:hypothetical protein
LPGAKPNSNLNTNVDADFDVMPDGNVNTYALFYSNCDVHSDSCADCNCHVNCNGYPNRYRDCRAKVYADAEAASHTRSTPITCTFSWLDSGAREQKLASFLFWMEPGTSALPAWHTQYRFAVVFQRIRVARKGLTKGRVLR